MVNNKTQNPPVLKDTLKIVGEVEIRNGDTVIKAKNRFVQTILQNICNMMSFSARLTLALNEFQGAMFIRNIYLGTDIAIPTAYNTTALTFPIGIAPGTAPNTLIGSTSNPSDGVFQITMTATWNSGTVSGTVGETALYLNVFPAGNLKAFGWSGLYQPGAAVLASRLSVADGSFEAFLIDDTKPLVVTWTLQVIF